MNSDEAREFARLMKHFNLLAALLIEYLRDDDPPDPPDSEEEEEKTDKKVAVIGKRGS